MSNSLLPHGLQYARLLCPSLSLRVFSNSCPWASLVTQSVKNTPAMWETWVQSLYWGDPLEEGMATHSSIIAWRSPMDRGAWWDTVHGVTKSWTDWVTKHLSNELVMPSNHLILWCPLFLLPQPFPASRTFPMNQFFTSGDQSIRASASASVLPMNI